MLMLMTAPQERPAAAAMLCDAPTTGKAGASNTFPSADNTTPSKADSSNTSHSADSTTTRKADASNNFVFDNTITKQGKRTFSCCT